ncbi:hypothetical protein FBEOM_12641 [Fusarium beomiforme]|uniref:F-box domain-containing protein n=1 Tax=Fusarium beomiforme TaxID=44412 RepID=A0A9P5A893_9HYPO|nr:hypothetical protein FBEOM_12641 [Fusarium beomiforme]
MPGLISLPAEIIEVMGRDLSVTDLNSASLACRVLRDNLTRCHFEAMAFQGTRSEIEEKLLRFLLHSNTPRVVAMGRVCRSLNLKILSVANDNFHESEEYLPALIHAAKKKLPRVTCLSIDIGGLSGDERTAFHWQFRSSYTWNGIRVLKADVCNATLKVLLECVPRNVLQAIDLVPAVRDPRLRYVKDEHPHLRRLRIWFPDPVLDLYRYFRSAQRVKLFHLSDLEELVIAETDIVNRPPRRGLNDHTYFVVQFSQIARSLSPLTNLRKLAIHYSHGILDWVQNPAVLHPGLPARLDLNTSMTLAIQRMGTKMLSLGEICIVEKTAGGAVSLVYHGRRDAVGAMVVTVEAPGPSNSYKNSFPLGVKY